MSRAPSPTWPIYPTKHARHGRERSGPVSVGPRCPGAACMYGYDHAISSRAPWRSTAAPVCDGCDGVAAWLGRADRGEAGEGRIGAFHSPRRGGGVGGRDHAHLRVCTCYRARVTASCLAKVAAAPSTAPPHHPRFLTTSIDPAISPSVSSLAIHSCDILAFDLRCHKCGSRPAPLYTSDDPQKYRPRLIREPLLRLRPHGSESHIPDPGPLTPIHPRPHSLPGQAADQRCPKSRGVPPPCRHGPIQV